MATQQEEEPSPSHKELTANGPTLNQELQLVGRGDGWSKAHTEWKSKEGAPHPPRQRFRWGFLEEAVPGLKLRGGSWEFGEEAAADGGGKEGEGRDWGFGAVAPANLRT